MIVTQDDIAYCQIHDTYWLGECLGCKYADAELDEIDLAFCNFLMYAQWQWNPRPLDENYSPMIFKGNQMPALVRVIWDTKKDGLRFLDEDDD